MRKKTNKTIITLLSGVVITIAVNLTIYTYALSNNMSKDLITNTNILGTIISEKSKTWIVKNNKSTTSSSITSTYTSNNTSGLNVKSGSSTSHSKIGKQSKGTKVIKTGTVNTTSINIRKGPSSTYAKIGSLSKGTKVNIINTEINRWYKISYNGSYGYVSGMYIYIDGEIKNLNKFLFVGDSFTVLLSNTIKSKNSNIYIHAKVGSMPGYWLDKVSSMPNNSKVDGVVLLIGVNGAGYESNKTNTKSLINKLSSKYPNKTIYVQKVFPVGRSFTSTNPYKFNQKISSLNSVIKSHCNTVPNAKYINATSGFVDSNGYLIHHNGDGLHIASSYNNQFYNNIFNAIKNVEK